MKTLFTIALALSLGTSSFAKEGTTDVKAASHVKVSEKAVMVSLDESLGKVRVVIADEKGRKLHQQIMFLKGSTRIPFDFSAVPSGSYKVEVASLEKKQALGKATYEIEIKDNTAPVALPLMASGKLLESNKVKLTVFGLEEPGGDVKIKNQFGTILYQEYINESKGFTKVYNFKDIKAIGLTMELTDVKGRHKSLIF